MCSNVEIGADRLTDGAVQHALEGAGYGLGDVVRIRAGRVFFCVEEGRLSGLWTSDGGVEGEPVSVLCRRNRFSSSDSPSDRSASILLSLECELAGDILGVRGDWQSSAVRRFSSESMVRSCGIVGDLIPMVCTILASRTGRYTISLVVGMSYSPATAAASDMGSRSRRKGRQ